MTKNSKAQLIYEITLKFKINKHIICPISWGTRNKVLKKRLERVTREFLRDALTLNIALIVTVKLLGFFIFEQRETHE